MYRLSRWWNRRAYFFIRLGQRMIWDYTGKNKYLMDNNNVASNTAEAILCDR